MTKVVLLAYAKKVEFLRKKTKSAGSTVKGSLIDFCFLINFNFMNFVQLYPIYSV